MQLRVTQGNSCNSRKLRSNQTKNNAIEVPRNTARVTLPQLHCNNSPATIALQQIYKQSYVTTHVEVHPRPLDAP